MINEIYWTEYGYFGSSDIYHKRILQNYKDGKLDGENTYYDKNGKIYWKGIYKDDILVNETSFIGSKGSFLLN